jgi:hypothetical protein
MQIKSKEIAYLFLCSGWTIIPKNLSDKKVLNYYFFVKARIPKKKYKTSCIFAIYKTDSALIGWTKKMTAKTSAIFFLKNASRNMNRNKELPI